LAERGIVSEIKTLVRSLYELRFQIKAITKDLVTAKRLIVIAQRKLRARLEATAKELSGKNLQAEQSKVWSNDEIKLVERQILAERPDLADKKDRLRTLTIKELARLADMQTDYEIGYSYLCEVAHSSAQNLEEMVSLDEQGNFIGFEYRQNTRDLLSFCFGGAALHLGNLAGTVDILRIGPPPRFDQLNERHKELEERLTTQPERA
jgi:hypothetical protein